MPRAKLTLQQRREVYRQYMEGRSVAVLADQYAVTPSAIYSILSGRTKSKGATRADKGGTREFYGMSLDKQTKEVLSRAQQGGEVLALLEFHSMRLLDELSDSKMSITSRVKILETVSRIQRYVHDQKLENHLRRPDAKIIMRIVRRFKPDATDEEIITMYSEEFEKWKSEMQMQ